MLWVSKFQCGAQSMKKSLGLLVPHVLLVLCSRPPHFWDFEGVFFIFSILKGGGESECLSLDGIPRKQSKG